MKTFSLKAIVIALFATSVVVSGKNSHHGSHGSTHKTPPTSSAPTKAASNVKLAAYVTDWALPSKIAWSKLDHVYYAFGIPDKTGALGSFDTAQLKNVVSEAHSNNKTISLSVGGWTGSLHFSTLVRTSASRDAFAAILEKAVADYNLDGIDIDWEYPNSPNGVACNSINSADTDNFLSLMKNLRQRLGDNKLITAAVATAPFFDSSQSPSSYLDSSWGTTVDYLNIMVYDLAGMWNPTTSSNSALKNGGDEGSVDQAIQQWTDAGFPGNKLVVGCPFYGYLAAVSQPVTASSENVPFSGKTQIQGDQYDEKGADPCPGATATYSGEYQYRSIVADGIQNNQSSWTTFWDDKTSTPYAYNSAKKTMLTFDNPASLKLKASYVVQNKLGGLMLWSLEMDDANNSLLSAMQAVRQ
ncbi:glycoside hydrolase superfamily [Halteromyces radiatus]|uniref:glycoside hydrolase superfamily n=1 Tax=Halteromyces radiatus TaxID=101107 RepID=UPI002220DE20|nr:glycoside hydrolase superfamily [Halteromyces radiatus]KAI8084794.1 glycoside hydrolase superfamily [Halteromyces radiatus]